MRKIILNSVIYSSILIIPFFLYLDKFTSGATDAYYLRFTTAKQNSMILGVSRAAQGIVPSVLNNADLDSNYDFFNFAFSGSTSPYGEIYYKAIFKKLDDNTKNGIFILGVNPLNLSYQYEKNPKENPDLFREKDSFLDKLIFMNQDPNLQYLFQFYAHPYYELYFTESQKQNIKLHNDAWLEVSIDQDEEKLEPRRLAKLATYKEKLKHYKISSIRKEWLNKLIRKLKTFGDVYLVRIPVDPRMYALEHTKFPLFEENIAKIANENEVKFFNFIPLNNTFKTTDANHLQSKSARRFTEILADSIKSNR